MRSLLLLVLILLAACACSDGNSPNALPQVTMATHMMRTSRALERIADVLENPNCICPPATRPAPVEEADGGVE
jgi:hypothetical protein